MSTSAIQPENADLEFDLDELDEVGSGIEPQDLVEKPGREIESSRYYCPHDGCTWWVPEDRRFLAESHVCPVEEGVYDVHADVIDAGDMGHEEYLEHFVGSDGVLGRRAAQDLIADLQPRPRSERIRLLFDRELFDYQKAVVDDPNPDTSVNCSRQVGKTEIGGAIGADAAIFKGVATGSDVMFAGDVKQTAVEMFRRAKEYFEERCLIPKEQLQVATDNKLSWEFEHGERILTGTLQGGGDTERGVLPKVIVVDESALIEKDAFEKVIEPMFATHGDDHELYLLSTPRGKSGYHYRANEPGLEPGYFSAHSVPASANPLVGEKFLVKKWKGTDEISWRQEWLGEFVEVGNVYIPTDDVRPCVADNRDAHPATDEHRYFIGIDVARRGNDRTVYTVLAGNGDIAYLDSEEQSDLSNVLAEIERLVERFDATAAWIDENAVGGGVVDFADHGLDDILEPFTFSTKKKQRLYRRLKSDFEDEELAIPSHSRLINETTSLTYNFTQNDKLKLSHPEGGHDDFPDSLALANLARHEADAAGMYSFNL